MLTAKLKTAAFPLLALCTIWACTSFRAHANPDAPFQRSAISIDTINGTVTLPMFRGRIRDNLVWYIVTESSTRADAHRRGVTWAPKLNALAGTAATQYGQLTDGMLEYTAGVDFSPSRRLRPAPDSGFPPLGARAGSIAQRGYSPFVHLRDGAILNAPLIADERGALDRVISMDVATQRVVLKMSRGYANDRHAWYISTEASDETVAAIERATYAPALATAPAEARSGILAIVNGVTDRSSADRQGLRSALLDDLSPLNVLEHAPDPAERDLSYSPLWNLHMAGWSASAISTNQREKVFTFSEAAAFAKRGLLASSGMGQSNPSLGGLRSAGVAVNCPLLVTFGRETH
jgi:hypothetical protein